MNEIINHLLLAGDKFMALIHLIKPRFTYSPCIPFTKNKEQILKIKETGDSRYIYQNELGKASFQYNMAYRTFKNFPRKAAADKLLRDKAFNIARNPNMIDIKAYLLQWFINCLTKSLSLVVLKVKLFQSRVLYLDVAT